MQPASKAWAKNSPLAGRGTLSLSLGPGRKCRPVPLFWSAMPKARAVGVCPSLFMPSMETVLAWVCQGGSVQVGQQHNGNKHWTVLGLCLSLCFSQASGASQAPRALRPARMSLSLYMHVHICIYIYMCTCTMFDIGLPLSLI